MAARINCEKLKDLRRLCRKSNLSGQDISSSPFTVLAIHRYIRDLKHRRQTGDVGSGGRQADGGGGGQDSSQPIDVIQLTLGDSQNKLKVILGKKLNSMVQNDKIRAGDCIRIRKCNLFYDETDLSSHGVLTVEEMVLDNEIIDTPDPQFLIWCEGCDDQEVPLTSSRGYFVNVWSTWQVSGDIWRRDAPDPQTLGDTQPHHVYGIKDLARNYNTQRRNNRPLIVRVCRQDELYHYAKPFKDDKWPFQARLWIEDQTGVCVMLLWNSMCASWYYRLKVGIVLLLRNYTVKRSFQVGSRDDSIAIGRQVYDIEVNMNSTNPRAEITVIDPAAVPDSLQLPGLKYNFINRRQAGCLPNDHICDIVGVVTYVGRYEREPAKEKFHHHGVDCGGFWVQQWVHVRDGSSSRPFNLQLYAVNLDKTKPDIRPGSILLCTNMRLIHDYDQLLSSRQQRNMYATTTKGSMASVMDADWLDSLAQTEDAVAAVRRWRQSQGCRDMLDRVTVGGYHPGSPVPAGKEQLVSWSKNKQMLCSSQWNSLMDFKYRERRQLLVQAIIVHAAFHRARTSSHSNRSLRSQIRIESANDDPVRVFLNRDLQGHDAPDFSTCHNRLNEDSLPVRYYGNQWNGIREKLALPRTSVEDDSDGDSQNSAYIKTVDISHIAVTWMSINGHKYLYSHIICPPNIPGGTTFTQLLSGSVVNLDHLSSQEPGCVSYEEIRALMDTVQQCSGMIYMVVLDCTKTSEDEYELIVNRAVPLKKAV